MPYGFPDGRTMMLDICERIMEGSYSQLIVGLDLSDNKSRDFAQEMKRSGLASVDAFLESRPEYIDVGKAAIAHYLIPYEIPGTLWPEKKKNVDGTYRWEKPRWYEYLFQKLKAEAETPKAFSENRLSIITYNYDRSLEYFLFTSIRNTFGLDESAAAQVFSTIPIVHIHGMLGPFAPVNEGRRFRGELSLEALALAAEHLRDCFKRVRSCKLRRVSKYWHKNAPCQANAKPIPVTSPRNNGATLNRFYQSPRPIRSLEDARRATFERSSMASCMSSGADVNGA